MTLLERLTAIATTNVRKGFERATTPPRVIGITGSVGKSSAKQAIAGVMRAAYGKDTVCVTTKNFNNELGLTLTVLGESAYPGRSLRSWMRVLWASWQFRRGSRPLASTYVLEMGADKPGDIAFLTSIARPSVGVVTAISPEDPSWAPVHAANYPSVADVAREKAKLIQALPASGAMVLNADDPLVIGMCHEASASRLFTFGTTEAADVQIVSKRYRMVREGDQSLPTGLEVGLRVLENYSTVYLAGVFGSSAAYALAAAAATGLACDIPVETILQGLAKYEALPGRARLIPGIKRTMLFDDSYNAAPASVLAALRDLAACEVDESSQRKIACLGEMRELGEQSSSLHERMGLEAARLGIDRLYVSGAQAEALVRGARLGGMSEDAIFACEDAEAVGILVQDHLRQGDLVLAKASEGPGPRHPSFGKVTGVRYERIIKELMAHPLEAGAVLCRQTDGWI